MSGVPGLIRALLPPAAPPGAQGQSPLDAAQLRAILDIGDVLTVKVLGQVVGRFTIEIAGRPAMAALPDGVAPGDLLQVRVEGFAADQVLLKLLARVPAPAAGTPTAPTTAPASSIGAQAEGVSSAPKASVTQRAAVPSEAPIVKEASVMEASVMEASATETTAMETSALEASATPGRATTPSFVIPRQATAGAGDKGAGTGDTGKSAPTRPHASEVVETPADVTPVRARLVAFRLSTASGVFVQPRRAVPPLPSAPPPSPQPMRVAPAETPSGPTQEMPAPRVGVPSRTVLPQFAAAAKTNAPTPRTAQAPEVTALRALRIPVTPTTLAAARIASMGSVRVAAALDTLQRALPLGAADPRVQQLRAIAEFVGTLDPRAPDVLPARLEAYVDHVLGGEARLAQTLLPSSGHAEPATAVPTHTAPEVGAARMAVARESMALNLKTHLMALLADGTGDGRARAALQQALTAVTAAQIQTLSLQDGTPQTLVIPLPLPFPQGGQQAYLRIARDGRRPGEPLSAESFHVALVLETRHHGTVAVELSCAERAVSVDVKAEREAAAAAFRRALPDLGARLERLAYRVARMDASVALVRGAADATQAIDAPAAASSESARGLDLRA